MPERDAVSTYDERGWIASQGTEGSTHMTDSSACEIVVTGPGATLARICRELVETRLAACTNVPEASVHSVYWWEGKVQTATETRAYIHTRAALADHVVAFIRERHPDDVPSITVRALIGGNAAYLRWVDDETTSPS
jgi:periplasmic divalent cation tolerance protein